MKRIFTVLLLVIGFGSAASDFENGLRAYSNGDYKSAAESFAAAGAQGDGNAWYYLGMMSKNGIGVPFDYPAALKAFRIGVQHGSAAAQYELGRHYQRANELTKAMTLFEASAEQGYAEAQHALGLMYLSGEGVRKNYSTAARWIQSAAEQGVPVAQFHIGKLMLDGKAQASQLRHSTGKLNDCI